MRIETASRPEPAILDINRSSTTEGSLYYGVPGEPKIVTMTIHSDRIGEELSEQTLIRVDWRWKIDGASIESQLELPAEAVAAVGVMLQELAQRASHDGTLPAQLALPGHEPRVGGTNGGIRLERTAGSGAKSRQANR